MVNLSGSTWLSRHVDFLLAQQHQRSRWYIGGQWTDRMRKSDFDQEKKTVVGDQNNNLAFRRASYGRQLPLYAERRLEPESSQDKPSHWIWRVAMAEISVREK